MADQKAFPTADVIGTITGVLLGDIGGIYAVCQFMSGEPIWTHQLPRVSREIKPVVLRQHPHLLPVIEEAAAVNRENWREKLTNWVDRFGDVISLTPMDADDHERIDPVSELAEMVPPNKIIVLKQ